MNRNYTMLGLVTATLFLSLIGGNNVVFAEKCKDITEKTLKWNPEGHGDNSPSEKKGEKMIWGDSNGENQETPCKIAKAIDHMDIKFVIKEHEWDEFVDTIAYMGTTEEVQDCFKDRHELPDDNGNDELQSYEYKDCQLGNY